MSATTAAQASANGGGGGGAPSGPAGGDLSGDYPDPGVAQINGLAPPTDGNLGAWNSNGQPVQPTSGTLAALTVTGITDPGTGPTSTGATAGGTVGVSTENHAWCQVLLFNIPNLAAGVHSDETPLSAAVVTTSPNQTIPWTCPISVPTQALGTVIAYYFGLCQGSSCTPANAVVSYTNPFSQTAAATTYPSFTPDPGNTTGTVLQGPATLNGGALCSAGTACALGAGSTATTQSAGDNSTNVATTAYADASSAAAAYPVANATFTISSSTTIANGACSPAAASSATQVAMTGVTTSMAFIVTATTDTAKVTGWGAPGAGVLYITDYPTAGNFNYHVCNNSGASITTGGSVTFNVSAR
jgi:hypothetical protein